jgi:uncharacterized membrane protein YheB (UPF0754 family)
MPEKPPSEQVTLEQAFAAIEKKLCIKPISEKAIGRAKFFSGSANNFQDIINFLVKTTYENYTQYNLGEFRETRNDWALQEKLIKEILKSVEPFDDKFKLQFEQFLAGTFYALLRSYLHDRTSTNSSKVSNSTF